jgi:hypothetical protein
MATKAKDRRGGLLMVMMESPEGDQREFQDWYDLEHVPERQRIKAFRTCQRYVCLEGWPRYMAMYDLDHPGVLGEKEYQAIGGANFSPWSKRIIHDVYGWVRVEGEQVLPGNAIAGAKGVALRVAVLRLRGVAAKDEAGIGGVLEAFLAGTHGVLECRLFKANEACCSHLYAIIEFSAPVPLAGLGWQRLALPSGAVDIANMYSRYWRRD